MAKKKETFKGLKAVDLEKKLAGIREDLRALRFKSEGAKSKNVKEALGLRKVIARVLTEINAQVKNK